MLYWRFDSLGNTILYGNVNRSTNGRDTFIYDRSGKLIEQDGYFNLGNQRKKFEFKYD